MVKYWITLSNYPSNTKERFEERIWWFHPHREIDRSIELGDQVIIYQPGSTKNAENSKEIIPETWQKRFIGYFEVEEIYQENDSRLSEEYRNDSNSRWLRITKEKLNPENKFILRKDIDDPLLLEITNNKNIGMIFRQKTWIPINEDYFEKVKKKLRL